MVKTHDGSRPKTTKKFEKDFVIFDFSGFLHEKTTQIHNVFAACPGYQQTHRWYPGHLPYLLVPDNLRLLIYSQFLTMGAIAKREIVARLQVILAFKKLVFTSAEGKGAVTPEI